MHNHHLKLLSYFHQAIAELKAAESILEKLLKHAKNNSALLQLSKEVTIEINRIEYLIREEIKRRENEVTNK